MKKFIMFLLSVWSLSGCVGAEKQQVLLPAIVPQSQKTEVKRIQPDTIGAVEWIYILPMKSAFEARIDTGAASSSIDASNIQEFERDGQKWVSFTVTNRRSGESHTFEKQIVKNIKIKRVEEAEHRLKVLLPVSFGGKKFSAEFTLANREDFEYQTLVGRSILTGRFVVDTSLSHTLK